MVFHDARVMAASQKQRFGHVVASFRVTKRGEADKVAQIMRELVSGGISTAELARRGHPFGRGRGRLSVTLVHGGRRTQHRTAGIRPATPLLPINFQSGRLKRSLRIIPEHYGGVDSFRIQFTAPEARYVLAKGGTRRMVARGYWNEVARQAEPLRKQTLYQMRLDQLRIMTRGA